MSNLLELCKNVVENKKTLQTLYYNFAMIFVGKDFKTKLFTIVFTVLSCLSFPKQANAGDYTYDYDSETNYNIFKSETWNLSFYSYFAYAFAWMPFFNNDGIPYREMLRNRHHGIVFGGGVAVNKNFLLGLSFEIISKVSHMRGEFSATYKEISGIRSRVFMTNIDLGVRMPMGLISPDFLGKIGMPQDLFRQYLNIYVVGGFNIISANLVNRYNNEYTMIPTSIAKSPQKVSLGINLGLAFTCRVWSALHIRTEVKKMFILTRKSSLPSDSWLFNIGLGVNF